MYTNLSFLLAALKDSTANMAAIQDFIDSQSLLNYELTYAANASKITIVFKDIYNEYARVLVITYDEVANTLTSYSNDQGAGAFVPADYIAAKATYAATPTAGNLTALKLTLPAYVTLGGLATAFPSMTATQRTDTTNANPKYFAHSGFMA